MTHDELAGAQAGQAGDDDAVGDDAGAQQRRRWRCPVTGALYEELETESETEPENTIREVRA